MDKTLLEGVDEANEDAPVVSGELPSFRTVTRFLLKSWESSKGTVRLLRYLKRTRAWLGTGNVRVRGSA